MLKIGGFLGTSAIRQAQAAARLAAKNAAKAADDSAKAAAKAADNAAQRASKAADDYAEAAAKASAANADDATKAAAKRLKDISDNAASASARAAKESAKAADDAAKSAAKALDDIAEASLKNNSKILAWIAKNPKTTFAAAAAAVFGAVVYAEARKNFDKNNGAELTINKIAVVDIEKPNNLQIMYDPGIKILKGDTVSFKDNTKIFPTGLLDKEMDINSIASRNEINITIPILETKTLGTLLVNNKELIIIRMTILDKNSPDNLQIMFDPKTTISTDSVIKFIDNSAVTHNVIIKSIVSDTDIKVSIPTLEKPASLGTLILSTTMDAWLDQAAADTTKSVFNNPVTKALGAVASGIGSGLGSIFGGLFNMFGPIGKWILIAVAIFAIFFLIKLFMRIFK
jgi:hypothetical protein